MAVKAQGVLSLRLEVRQLAAAWLHRQGSRDRNGQRSRRCEWRGEPGNSKASRLPGDPALLCSI